MPDGTLVFDTKIDKAGFENGMRQLEKQTDKLGSTLKGVLGGNIASQILTRGTEMLFDLGKAAVMTASDLAEVQNVVDVTFGEGAAAIDAFAKSAMENFGLTELQAKQYTSTLGAMFKSMGLSDDEIVDMSTDMAALVGDMASFYNLDHETAFQKIRAGLSGETEPLKQLGINLSVANLEAFALAEGLGKTYEEMTEAERANLRFAYVMQATADAQGDFVRTSDGFANQLRILQGNLTNLGAEVGNGLLPVLEDALGFLNSILSGDFGTGNETISKINDVTRAFDSIESEIQEIRNDYAKTTVEINVDYRRADDLIRDLGRLKQLESQGVNVTSELQTVSAQLLSVYPGLAEHMGENGIINAEVGYLQQYNEEMREAARQAAYMQMVSRIEGVYGTAEANYYYLSTAKSNARREVQSLQDEINLLNSIDTKALADTTLFAQGLGGNVNAAETIRLIEAYIDMFGSLEGVDTSRIDLSQIFDDQGNIKQDASIFALTDLLVAISRSELGEDTRAQYEEAQRELAAVETALSESAEAYRDAAAELETAMQTYNRLFEPGSETPDYIGQTERRIAEETEYNTGVRLLGGVGEVGDAIKEDIIEEQGAIAAAVEDGIPDKVEVEVVPVVDLSLWGRLQRWLGSGAPDGSHATGIDRVPYNNYLARLHVGEAVLSARDAESWRSTRGIDYGAMAAAIVSALPNNPGGAGGVTKLYIDGVELASTQASNNRSALAVRSNVEARGYGKR